MFQNKLILFLIILVMVVSLRLFYLNKGYNSDEGWLLKAASTDLDNLMGFLREGRGGYPPLSPFLLHLWTRLSNSEIWIRGYFVIFGVALCILVYIIGKSFFGEKFGLTVFLLSGISPLLIWSSQFIRSYIDSAFWVTLSIYFMVKILKGSHSRRNFFLYVIFSTLSLYSSYINALILISQSIFVFAFYFNDLKFLRKWIMAQIFIVIFFVPCLPLILRQYELAPAIDPKWGERGFQLFGLSLGAYARSIAGILGLDPGFLTTYPLTQELNRLALFGLASLSFCIVGWFFIKALKGFRNFFNDRRLIWFFPFISVSALILYNVLVEIMSFPSQVEYFVAQHVLFLFVMAAVICSVKMNGKINILIMVLISLIFLLRFPGAVRPEFETKKAYAYLVNNIEKTDLLLMVRNTNLYINPKAFNVFLLTDYIKRDNEADYYKPFDTATKAAFSKIKEKYQTICFYRTYGNDEILGANRLVMNWLQENGYDIKNVQRFRRIDIVYYKRLN